MSFSEHEEHGVQRCFCLVFPLGSSMWKKMKICDFASVVTTSVTELTMALVVPASETLLIQRIMRRRLKEWRTKR